MRVSARLHATAAPDARGPMIRTSTISSVGRTASGRAAADMSTAPVVDIAPHPGPAAHRLEQRPLARLQHPPRGEGRPRLEPEGTQHAVVAVVALQHGTPEGGRDRALTAEQGHGGPLPGGG